MAKRQAHENEFHLSHGNYGWVLPEEGQSDTTALQSELALRYKSPGGIYQKLNGSPFEPSSIFKTTPITPVEIQAYLASLSSNGSS